MLKINLKSEIYNMYSTHKCTKIIYIERRLFVLSFDETMFYCFQKKKKGKHRIRKYIYINGENKNYTVIIVYDFQIITILVWWYVYKNQTN
jgi:hypothetical protein